MSPLIRRAFRNFTAAAIPAGIAAAFAFQAPVASAATASPRSAAGVSITLSAGGQRGTNQPARLSAYAWAVTQTGHPYMWGGTGPGYDCSGLVMMAYLHAGIHLPRTTTQMLASPLLVRVQHPRMGDLAFYGSGHVELFRRWGYTFGAHDSDSPVGLVHYGWGWVPTAFYRVG